MSMTFDVTNGRTLQVANGRYAGLRGQLVGLADSETLMLLVDPASAPTYQSYRDLAAAARRGLVIQVHISSIMGVGERLHVWYWHRRRQFSRSAARAVKLLDAWGALLPARIANEDLGDYLEDVARRIEKGQGALVYLSIAAAMFWTGVNALGYLRKKAGRRSAG